jgi:N6-adenosine-specific RNA methylase IME4
VSRHTVEQAGRPAKVADAYRILPTRVKDRIGTGDWLRDQTEHCILSARGRPVIQLANQTTALNGIRREHSRKPEEFYELVDQLCPGSKVELFSRQQREGWRAFGNQTDKFLPLPAGETDSGEDDEDERC